MKDFNGKVVYIVGGSNGIGLAIAELLAAKGAHVIIFARRQELLEQALSEIKAKAALPSQRFSCMALDIADHDQVKIIMSKAVAEFGTPDVLINCAGVSHPGYFENITYEHFDETMKVNLYGMWSVVWVLVHHMKERGGYIVNVSSIAGFIGLFGATAYAASKFATVGFFEALRSEYKHSNIEVSVLCPPDTDTPLLHEANKTKPEETAAISGKAKLMQPEEVAQALIKGMGKKQFMIIPGFDGKWIYLAKRLFPRIINAIIDSSIRKVQAKKARQS